MKISSYMTRALAARDRRYATVLEKLGYARPVEAARASMPAEPDPDPDLETLRAEYEALAGEPADKRWGVPRLTAAIAAMSEG